MKSCLIGGAGFIGSHVARLLVKAGRQVTVLGRSSQPINRLPPSVIYVSGDYGDRAVLRQVLEGADEVIDLAYATVPQTSFVDPVFDILANLPASVGLLQEAAAAGVAKLVVISSGGTVYGVAQSFPISEDHPTNPISPYGITKLTIEKYAQMFKLVQDLHVVVVRPGNAYGEEQRAFGGQGLIAMVMHSIIAGQEVSIFGSNGTIRDFVHVSDIASGIVAALERGAAGNIYNVGTGIGKSTFDVLTEIEPLAKNAGYALRTRTVASRKFDVPANILDSRKLEAVSGWRAGIDFAEGIDSVWRAVLAGRDK